MRRNIIIVLLSICLCFVAHIYAEGQSPSAVYLEYLETLKKASSLADIEQFLAQSVLEQCKGDEEFSFAMIKETGNIKDLEILDESINGDEAKLTIKAQRSNMLIATHPSSDSPEQEIEATAEIILKKEDNRWRIAEESWEF